MSNNCLIIIYRNNSLITLPHPARMMLRSLIGEVYNRCDVVPQVHCIVHGGLVAPRGCKEVVQVWVGAVDGELRDGRGVALLRVYVGRG